MHTSMFYTIVHYFFCGNPLQFSFYADFKKNDYYVVVNGQ